MSYILDALKRADADRDRQRAAVPDLHAQTDVYTFREAEASGMTPRWLGGAALLALAGAGAAWWFFGGRDAPAVATTVPPAVVATNPFPETRVAQPAAEPPAAPVWVAPAPAPAPTTPPATPPAPPRTAAPAAPTAGPTVAPAATALPAPAAQPRTAQARPPTAAVPAAPPVPPERIPLYAALPPALRSQMPALSVNGSVYSRTRASRIVILNGQVFREGDRPTDGLVVEEIRLKSSVLSFRGTRFELPH